MSRVTSLDSAIFSRMMRVGQATKLRRYLTRFFGEFFPYIVFILFILVSILSSRRVLYIPLTSALIARFGIVELIRIFYRRRRPHEFPPGTSVLIHAMGKLSFPSGHAVFFSALGAGLFTFSAPLGFLFLLSALVMSIARIAAGVHWPSDVVVGVVIGVSFGFLGSLMF